MLNTHEEAEILLDQALAKAEQAAQQCYEKYGEPNTLGSTSISIYPARGKLVTVLKRRKLGATLSGHGFIISAYDLHSINTQSVDIHESAADAFCECLSKHGIRAYRNFLL